MSKLWNDARFGLRMLLRRPGFTTAALISLVLGLGVTTAIFSLFWSFYLKPLPVEELDRLVAVFQSWQDESGEYGDGMALSHDFFREFRDNSSTLEGLAAYLPFGMSLTGGERPERIQGCFASAGFFDVLGLEPVRGRFFLPEDDEAWGGAPVTVLSWSGWQRLFAGDPEVVGREVQINGQPYSVVGVAPEGFRGLRLHESVDLWVPTFAFPVLTPYEAYFTPRDGSIFQTVGRLAPGVTREQAEAELMGIARQISETLPPGDDLGAEVVPLRDELLPEQFRDNYMGFGRVLGLGTVVLLLMACVNVASLLLVRGLERGRELAVRQAVGAGRRQVARQLTLEALVLFLIGAVVSVPVAYLLVHLLWRFRPPEMASLGNLGLDPAATLFALGLALGTGLLFGLVPAWRASRLELTEHLKERPDEAAAAGGGAGGYLKASLVALQVALALVALVGAALFQRSLENLRGVDLGFQPEEVAVFTVSPLEQGLEEDQGRDLYRRIRERLESLPQVESVAVSENRVLRGAVVRHQVWLPGAAEAAVSPSGDYHRTNAVSPGYFETIGLPLLRGRDFDQTDRAESRPVAIVNETMARSLWPGEEAVGKVFHFDFPEEPPVEVVGVAADARYRNIQEDPQFFIYIPVAQAYPARATFHLRTAGDPSAVLPRIRETLHQMDPNLVLADLETLQHFVDAALWTERVAALALSAFGLVALLLALVGVYGVVSYSVTQKRRELGIRRALGARAGSVLGRVLREALAVVAAGLVLGWLLAYLVLRPLIASQLVEVEPGDPSVYALQGLLLALIAVLASLVPAWKALRVEPMAALREE